MSKIIAFPAAPPRDLDRVIVDLERQGDVVKRLLESINVKPVEVPDPTAPLAELERCAEANRTRSANLPAIADLSRLAGIWEPACQQQTRAKVIVYLADLATCYPNFNPSGLSRFLETMADDIEAEGLCDAVVRATCVKVRRSRKFFPTIAEFLEDAREVAKRWSIVPRLLDLRTARQRDLEAAMSRAEHYLAEARKEVAQGYRDEAGERLKPRPEIRSVVAELLKGGQTN